MTPPHSQITPDRIVEIAAHQKLLMYCVLVVVLLSILGPGLRGLVPATPSSEAPFESARQILENALHFLGFFQLAGLFATWVAALALLSQADRRLNLLAGTVVGLLLLTPLLNAAFLPIPLAILWAIDRDARRRLREHGVPVGLMGADVGALRRRLASRDAGGRTSDPPGGDELPGESPS